MELHLSFVFVFAKYGHNGIAFHLFGVGTRSF